MAHISENEPTLILENANASVLNDSFDEEIAGLLYGENDSLKQEGAPYEISENWARESLESNQKYQFVLRQLQNSIKEILLENKDKQSEVLQTPLSGDDDFIFKTEEPNCKIGKAYFVDLDGMPCPPNEDTTQRIRNRECDMQLSSFTIKWKELDKRRLEKSVRKAALGKLKEPLLNRKRDLAEQLEEISAAEAAKSTDAENKEKTTPAGGKSVAKIKQQMKEVKEKLALVKGEPLKAMLRNPRVNINWQYIASEYFEDKHDEYKCQGMWYNLLSPNVSRSNWSETETQHLLKVATMFNFQDWDNIAIQLNTNRTAFQCFKQFQKTLNKSRQEWSSAEDEMLKHCVQRFKKDGYIPFREIATYIPGRSALQCEQRWHSMLNPAVFQGKFKQVEDAIIYEARKANLSFKQIEYMLPGRTQDQLRYRWGRLQLEVNFRSWTKEEDDLLIQLVKEQAAVNRVSFTALVPHFDRRNRHMLRSRYVCLQQNRMAPSRKRTRNIGVPTLVKLLDSDSSSDGETYDSDTATSRALDTDEEGTTVPQGSSSSTSAGNPSADSTSGTPVRSMPVLMETSLVAGSSAKSLSTNTVATSSEKTSTSTTASVKPTTSTSDSGKPSTSTSDSGKPSTSTAASGKSSTSTAASEKPSTSTSDSGKPSKSTSASVKPSTSTAVTSQASIISVRPSTSTASSRKPSTKSSTRSPAMPEMIHIKTGFNKLLARHTSLMGRKSRNIHPIESEICNLFYSYYPQMTGRVRKLFSPQDIRYLSGEIQQLMEMLQTSLDWTKGERLVSKRYVATYMVHRCLEVKREEEGEKRQQLPSRDTRLLNLMPPNITTVIGIRTLLLEMPKLKNIIDKKYPWNPSHLPESFEASDHQYTQGTVLYRSSPNTGSDTPHPLMSHSPTTSSINSSVNNSPSALTSEVCSNSNAECSSSRQDPQPSPYTIKLNQWDPIDTRASQVDESPSDVDVYMDPHVAVSLFKQRFYSLFYWGSTMNSVRARVYDNVEEEPHATYVKPVEPETGRKPKLTKIQRKRMLKQRWKNYRKGVGEIEEEKEDVKPDLTMQVMQECNLGEPGRKRYGSASGSGGKNKNPVKKVKIEPGLKDTETVQQGKERQQCSFSEKSGKGGSR